MRKIFSRADQPPASAFSFLFDANVTAALLILPGLHLYLSLCERVWKSLKYLTHITMKKGAFISACV